MLNFYFYLLLQVLQNTDGDPCNSYEWSCIFIFLFVLSFVAMGLHLWALW